LNPDPIILVQLLQENKRSDLAHGLLLQALDAYVGIGREKKRVGAGEAGFEKK